MFSLANGIYQSYFAPPKLSILIIGLDGSGKTSLLERIKVTDVQTRIGVTPACNAPSLPASYAKGAAVAGVGNSIELDGMEDGSHQREHLEEPRPRRGGQHQGGRPARLPPPLPPKQALKSHQRVEKMLADGFSGDGNADTKEECAAQLLRSVPPPPLMSEGNSSSEEDKEQAVASGKKMLGKPAKAQLPPRHDGLTKKPAAIPVPSKKKGSFMELLRCPSPKKYSDAALGEDDDEEYHDNTSNNNPVQKDALEPWSTEYLENYYINYEREEEFDVKKQRNGGGPARKMFPLDRIRPTLGQNLAKLDMCGCKCSIFDLSGAEKMRPLWERYYRDTDAIIYVVNAAETSATNLNQSRREFEQVCCNDALQKRVQSGLPVLIFANKLDVAYEEYEASLEKANNERNGRGISWNADEEDDFVGGGMETVEVDEEGGAGNEVSRRAVDFNDLAILFGFPQQSSQTLGGGMGNVFLFGGSAKSGEGVRAAMEYLVAHAKSYHLARVARR